MPCFKELSQLMDARKAGQVKVDGVILATPNFMHVGGAIMCAQNGLPTLIEKPVTGSQCL